MRDVSDLFSAIARQMPILDAKRAGAELYGAPRLNAFSLFNPNENTISRIAQDFLDPGGSHGQGSLFLNALMSSIGLPRVGHTDAVRVRREMRTKHQRRIDLVIETPQVLAGIENKPWAGQQPNQLRDYLDALSEWAGKRTPVLVFLSDQEPKTAKDEVVVLPFVDDSEGISLRSILADVLDGIRAPRARTHVQEFIAYIDEQFGEAGMVDQGDEAYLEAVEVEFGKSDRRRAVAAVMLAQSRLHAQILDGIGDFLSSELGEGFELVDGLSLSEAVGEKCHPWLARRPSWPKNLAVAIEADRSNYGSVYFGIRAPIPADAEVKEAGLGCLARSIIEPALMAVPGGGKTKWWPWWAWAQTKNWTPEFSAKMVLHSPTGMAEDHPEVAELAERLVSLAETVDQALRISK